MRTTHGLHCNGHVRCALVASKLGENVTVAAVIGKKVLRCRGGIYTTVSQWGPQRCLLG